MANAYFITFSTYGARLHGDSRGTVDRAHNVPGQPLLPENEGLLRHREALMTAPAFQMTAHERATVLAALCQHATFRGWTLLAAHVRTTHAHVVVVGDAPPEKMMTEFKSYASRALNCECPMTERRSWARHGSTRWLNSEESIAGAIRYTVEEQGEPMAVFDSRAAETSRERQ